MRFAPRWTTCPNAALPSSLSKWQAQAARSSAQKAIFAGKLIQDSGMQGHSVGDAQVSTKHAGFVVNTGNASAADVLQVIRDVQAAVADQFGVTLETEVRMWGFDPTNN